jgi:hypothetical protein
LSLQELVVVAHISVTNYIDFFSQGGGEQDHGGSNDMYRWIGPALGTSWKNMEAALVVHTKRNPKRLFPRIFLAVSLHLSILLYIWTSHSKGNWSSFKTQDLGAIQKTNPKA